MINVKSFLTCFPKDERRENFGGFFFGNSVAGTGALNPCSAIPAPGRYPPLAGANKEQKRACPDEFEAQTKQREWVCPTSLALLERSALGCLLPPAFLRGSPSAARRHRSS